MTYETFKPEGGSQVGPKNYSAISMRQTDASGFANKMADNKRCGSDQGKNISPRISCNL